MNFLLLSKEIQNLNSNKRNKINKNNQMMYKNKSQRKKTKINSLKKKLIRMIEHVNVKYNEKYNCKNIIIPFLFIPLL